MASATYSPVNSEFRKRAADYGLMALGLLGCLWIAALLSPILIIGWQTLHWLQHGVWERWSVLRAMDYASIPVPHASWVGVQKIIYWYVELPLALALPCTAMLLLWIVAALFAKADA